jgi:hypothetical protein
MKNLLRCRAVPARSKRVGYKGICSALTALFSHQPGATPQELGYTNDKALKARFSHSRLQRWRFVGPSVLGRLPQVRHGESVLWRTGNDYAPLALNRCGQRVPP